jgi:transcription initiation factor TFIIIB Brf1 subunit/transcription initiation factor TFIIB
MCTQLYKSRDIRLVPTHDIDNACTSKHTFILTDPVAGEIICINCGVVISDRSQESRPVRQTFTNNGLATGSRGGRPASLAIHDQGLSTIIGRDNRDHTGEMIIDESTTFYSAEDKNLGLPNANQEFERQNS